MKKRVHVQILDAPHGGKSGDWYCPECNHHNYGFRKSCQICNKDMEMDIYKRARLSHPDSSFEGPADNPRHSSQIRNVSRPAHAQESGLEITRDPSPLTNMSPYYQNKSHVYQTNFIPHDFAPPHFSRSNTYPPHPRSNERWSEHERNSIRREYQPGPNSVQLPAQNSSNFPSNCRQEALAAGFRRDRQPELNYNSNNSNNTNNNNHHNSLPPKPDPCKPISPPLREYVHETQTFMHTCISAHIHVISHIYQSRYAASYIGADLREFERRTDIISILDISSERLFRISLA